MTPTTAAQPTPDDLAIWSQGSRTVSQLMKETGLSRNTIWDRMNDGTFAWCVRDGWGTRLVAWRSVTEYLARLAASQKG